MAAVQFLFLLAAATVVVGLAGGVVAGLVLGARLVRVTAQAVVQLKQRRQIVNSLKEELQIKETPQLAILKKIIHYIIIM